MPTNRVCGTRVGVFATRAAALRAVADLKDLGYRDDQIGLATKDTGEPDAGATLGTAGAVGGAAVGAGILTGVIPVVGPVLAIGTLGAALADAADGAAPAGLASTLVGWGVPDEDAKFYEGEVRAGRYLVTAECGDRTDVPVVYARHGGFDRATAVAAST